MNKVSPKHPAQHLSPSKRIQYKHAVHRHKIQRLQVNIVHRDQVRGWNCMKSNLHRTESVTAVSVFKISDNFEIISEQLFDKWCIFLKLTLFLFTSLIFNNLVQKGWRIKHQVCISWRGLNTTLHKKTEKTICINNHQRTSKAQAGNDGQGILWISWSQVWGTV